MLYFFRLLLFLINIDQETVLNWFGIEDTNKSNIFDLNLSSVEVQTSPELSLDTLKLILEGLWNKINEGLTLSDIENILFFILFIRFIILAIRYNLKTSFFITCIGLVAGYLWYRHLIDLISLYRNALLNIPFFSKLGMDATKLREYHRQMSVTKLRLGENVHWYNPIQLISYTFRNAIIDVDPETGFRHYIDPISMAVSNLKEPTKSSILPFYYKIYNEAIPKLIAVCSKYGTQLSGIVAYTVVTRIGKRYCPYLIRWHWTLLLVLAVLEPIIYYFVFRVLYFQEFVLMPQLETLPLDSSIDIGSGMATGSLNLTELDPMIIFQINSLTAMISAIVIIHIGLIIFGMLHATCGQYFYLPLFTENTELHIGPRPKNSVYSGGNTAWQDPEEKEKNRDRFVPKFWYGWFGHGTKDTGQVNNIFKKFIKTIFKILKKKFRK
jgi:hypothetical protein